MTLNRISKKLTRLPIDFKFNNFRRLHKATSLQMAAAVPKDNSSASRSQCIFCRIVDGKEKDSNDKILYQDEELAVFPDIKPAAKYHLLVVTKDHIRDAKVLSSAHSPLLDRMVETGKRVLLEKVQGDSANGIITEAPENVVEKSLLGFHWPPFHTVSHLHLHVIAPSTQIGFVGKLIFRPNSYWFVQPEWVKQKLESST